MEMINSLENKYETLFKYPCLQRNSRPEEVPFIIDQQNIWSLILNSFMFNRWNKGS